MGPAASAIWAVARALMTASAHSRKSFMTSRTTSSSTAECLEDSALDQALRNIDLVGVETHRSGDGADLRGGLLDGLLDVLALQSILYHLSTVRHRRHSAEGDATVLPVAARVDGERRGDRHQGKVVDLAVLELRPGHLG